MHPRIRAVWPGAATAGPAYSVTCATADNLAVHAAVVEAPAGSVLVVATDPPERGYWGEVLTTGAEARGLRGLVIDGGVRDVAALEAHRFPVFSAVVALRGAAKVAGGEMGGVARVGDVDVQSGDWVVADRDGVTVIARGELHPTIERGRAGGKGDEDVLPVAGGGDHGRAARARHRQRDPAVGLQCEV